MSYTPPSRYISQLYVIPAVDAVEAGKGQLEISVNQGQVPNNVQMQDAGRCLVTFIPQKSGTYVIDVTFNGHQVHGCPIKVDVHAKQVGKPVATPVFSHTSGGAGIGGTTPPPRPPSTERGPSSAYFSGGSPRIDTYSSYAPSPSSLLGGAHAMDSPRSPPLVAHVQQRSAESGAHLARAVSPAQQESSQALRSPRLVQASISSSAPTATPTQAKSPLGYTVAHYGENAESPAHPSPQPVIEKYHSTSTTVTHKYFGDKPPSEAPDSTYSPVKPHKYFDRIEVSSTSPLKDHPDPEWSKPFLPESETAQFEMTRSAELTLYKEHVVPEHHYASREHIRTEETLPAMYQPIDTRVQKEENRLVPAEDYKPRHYDQVPELPRIHIHRGAEEPQQRVNRASDLPYTPLEANAKKTAEMMRMRDEEDRIHRPHDSHRVDEELYQPVQTHIVEPYSSDIEPMTPGTRRKLLEHTVYKATELKESVESTSAAGAETTDVESEPPSSKHSSKPTTPRLSLKMKSRDKTRDPTKFDFGKSKISSKHEVVRRGKDVEVKIESLKLAKEDQLKVIVMPPTRARADPSEQVTEIPHRLKKSGKSYEISFQPTEVGTHKVLVFVNNQFPHPQTPFPVRVYDPSEIIVGDIVSESIINDTVEFTVDAGRAGFGNLEMAIKDSDGVIIPSHVSQLEAGTAKFLVTFNPSSFGAHTVNITFNKEVIKGSPFEVNIVEPETSAFLPKTNGATDSSSIAESQKKEKLKEKEAKVKKAKADKAGGKSKGAAPVVTKLPSLSRVGKQAELLLTIPPTALDQPVEVTVKDPEKNEIPVEILDEEPNVKRIQFTSTKVGDHDIDVKVGGTRVNGSPFTCRSYDPAKIFVENITDGVVNKAVHFTVDASAAGVGNLEVAVNEGKIPSMAHALGQHRYDISFVPTEAIDHYISVRFNNEPVPGSPFLCHIYQKTPKVKVVASGPGLERVSVNQPVEIWLDLTPEDPAAAPQVLTAPSIDITDSRSEHIAVKLVPEGAQGPAQRYVATYQPKHVGNHQIEIKYEDEPIQDSPFTSKAFDATCVKLALTEKAQVGKPCTFTIDAAKAGAGNMEIIVSVEKKNVPNFVQAEGQAKFKVSFTPQEPNEHVISVRFNGIHIPGSPMSCLVSGPDISSLSLPKGLSGISPPPHIREEDEEGSPTRSEGELRLVGDLAVAEVGKTKQFSIDAPVGGGRRTECNVIVTGPDQRRMPVQVTVVDSTDQKGFDVEFLPTKSGDHEIVILIDGRTLDICPIICQAIALEDNNFGIDAESNPEVKILSLPQKALIEHSTRFDLELMYNENRGLDNAQLDVDIFDQDGAKVVISLAHIRGNVYSVEWTPLREGRHRVCVKVNGRTAVKTHIDVLDLSAVRIIGLRNDVVGVQQNFKVDWSNSGGSTAHVSVVHENGQRVKCHMKKAKDGLHLCYFTPHIPGLYLLTIYVDDMPLPECPYECVISSEGSIRAIGDALRRAQRGRTARFEVSLGSAVGRGDLDVNVTDPHNGPLPVRCYKQQDDSYWVEFTPEQNGTHKIDITFGDEPIAGSPFFCEIVDPRKVIIHGIDEPTNSIVLRNIASVTVDRKHAGKGELSFEILDPQGKALKVDHVKISSGEDRFSFLPSKLGPHKLNVKIGGFLVPAPHTLEVVDQSKPCVYGAALDYAVERNQQASMIFDPKKMKGGLKIEVRSPTNEKVRHSTNKRPDGTSEIAFRPIDVGHYSINVDFNNKPVEGSPFGVDIVDPTKVVINDKDVRDDGMLQLFNGEKNVIDVDATAAGPGKLRAEIRNSEGDLLDDSKCRVQNIGYGKFQMIIQPVDAGKHKLYLYWSDLVVPSVYPLLAISERRGHITPSRGTPQAARKQPEVVMRGEGLQKAIVREPAEFVVDCNECPEGTLTATLIGDKADIPVRIMPLNDNVYKCTYTPLVPGKYELNLMLDGEPVGRSPRKVEVQGYSSVAELIEVDTKTLKLGIIGEDVKTVIDARKAGPGHLSAQCVGPSQLEYCELFDNRDGTYVLRVTPKELGKHTLSIKYANEHVPGSPYTFTVSNPPDPSQVKVSGPGIEHGILHSFKSNFVVETRGAGAGQLTVRVRGPKGAFNVEMQRDRSQDRTIHCKYEPREPGDYSIEVKWHGKHVPGSPFLVLITDTQQELERFLAGGAPSPQPPTPFTPPGWLGGPPIAHPQYALAAGPYGPVPMPPPGSMAMMGPPGRGRPPPPAVMPGPHHPYPARSRHQHY